MKAAPEKRWAGKSIAGFSLVEVVIAIGIVAATMTAALGFAGALSSVAKRNRDTLHALDAANAMIRFVGSLDFDEVAGLLLSPDEFGDDQQREGAVLSNDAQTVLCSYDGMRVGLAGDPIWTGGAATPAFQGTLVRDAQRSPASGDAGAAWLAFSLQVRWPVTSFPTERGIGHTITFSGSVHR